MTCFNEIALPEGVIYGPKPKKKRIRVYTPDQHAKMKAYWKEYNLKRSEAKKTHPDYQSSRVQDHREFKETWEQYKAKLPPEELAKFEGSHTIQTKEYKHHYYKWRMQNDDVFRETINRNRELSRKRKSLNKTPEIRAKLAAYKRAYLKANPERKRKYRARDYKNPKIKLIRNLRNRFTQWLSGRKKLISVSQSVGMNMEDFKAYLESKFRPGMSWSNYGHGKDKWVIDHIIPLSTAQWDQDKVMKLFHYTNMQPLWWHENQEKSDRLDWQLTKSNS